MDRITNSEYERGWWDCFDKIKENHEAVGNYTYTDFNELEKEFNESCGGHRSQRTGESDRDLAHRM